MHHKLTEVVYVSFQFLLSLVTKYRSLHADDQWTPTVTCQARHHVDIHRADPRFSASGLLLETKLVPEGHTHAVHAGTG